MAARMEGSRRILRAGIILLAGWVTLEIVLFQLVAARIGWGALLALLSIKGGIGLFLIGALMVRGLATIRTDALHRRGLEAVARAGFGVASAVLIVIPGLIPPLIGVALFSPSLQAAILRRFGPFVEAVPKTTAEKNFDLAADDWREVQEGKRAGPNNTRKGPDKPKPLETKPPSV